MAKKAVISTGGKQYIVSEGETIMVELLGDKAKTATFDTLLVIDGETTKVGAPLVEGSKVAGSKEVYRPLNDISQKLKTRLYASGSISSLLDGNTVLFNNAFSDEVDGQDLVKMDNFGENFGILRNAKTLSVESRKDLTGKDTIFFKMWNMKQQEYQLEFNGSNMAAAGATAMLEDTYLKTKQPISLETINRVTFSVGEGPSAATDRFRIVFEVSTPVPVRFTTLKAWQKNSDIQVDWKVATESGIVNYEVEHSTDGRNFSKVGTVAATNAATYNWLDVSPAAGAHFYRIKSIGVAGESRYTTVVKVVIGSGKTGITVYPNPVKGGVVTLQFANQAAGKYGIRLINTVGQVLYKTVINQAGGNSSETFSLPAGIAKGIYKLELNTPGNKTAVRKMIVD